MDRYSIELERAIFNFRYSGESSPQPIINAVCAALDNGVQIDRTKIPESILTMLDTEKAAQQAKPLSVISVVKGSVVDMHAGAIVNAANTSLLGGGGVDGAIHRAAGHELLEECRSLNGCKTGGAKITKAYNITNADRIIHTVGPVYRGKPENAEALASCYRNSLDLALKNGITSIAFPGISTGIYGYPRDEAARIALDTVNTWFNENSDIVMNVYFCCFRDEELSVYRELIKN